MIMAGRGRRLLNTTDKPESVGIPSTYSADESVDLSPVVNKIKEIDTSSIDSLLLQNLQSQFKQLFTSKEVMRNVLSDLHAKALQDAEFGEKLVVALEQVLNFEIEGALLRGELLSFIQNDFKVKETMSESDPKKFINSVILLGNVFQRIKVCGTPIAILGVALLEYFDLLIKGDEEQLKILTKQILINGSKLLEVNKYELLHQNLRNTLITKNLNCLSKCWILLAIDFLSNGLKPLKGILRDFYITNLGSEYQKLEACMEVLNESEIHSPSSNSDSIKVHDTTSPKSKNFNTSSGRSDSFKKDLSKKFSDMSVKGSGKKEKTHSSPGKGNKKDAWKFGGSTRGNSGHDDRFEKEENFYGVQKPRDLKPESQKKKFNDSKISNKKLDRSNTSFSDEMEPENISEVS